MTVRIHFVTSSDYKREENAILSRECTLSDGRIIGDVFEFVLVSNQIVENLEADLVELVRAEAMSAYSQIRKPCLVEHAGLVFADYADQGYPGGLTKPMWNTLGENFVAETQSRGRAATARAVIGYCDGKSVHIFLGETKGTISDAPRGSREFYWDTVFIPEGDNPDGLTYAEIVEKHGLPHKVTKYSQSTKAMTAFLTWRLTHDPDLWNLQY